ncbi:MAG: 1,2-phenylacetyl-CoA epoxidase subunit B [Acidimicrobiia bacterium]|nr:1,2-phenylacetyl-CoA epoxidase subunit B [Acidimicrobiia bacterium]
MPYEIHTAPGEEPPDEPQAPTGDHGWPLWEVFVRQKRGLAHIHAGSLHAPDPETALQSARDVYTRRLEGVSIWVVPSSTIVASDPDDAAELFEPAADKAYRHPTFYDIPDEVGHM